MMSLYTVHIRDTGVMIPIRLDLNLFVPIRILEKALAVRSQLDSAV
jgi:hypothetical protein